MAIMAKMASRDLVTANLTLLSLQTAYVASSAADFFVFSSPLGSRRPNG